MKKTHLPSSTTAQEDAGVLARFRRYKERSGLEKAIKSAIERGDGEEILKAKEPFESLSASQQARVILSIGKSLPTYSRFVFESARKVAALTVAAEFFSYAAKKLPLDSEGCRLTAEFGQPLSVLKSVFDNTYSFDENDETHARLRSTCAEALWEFEYGSFPFWETRLLDSTTMRLTITKLLEMEPVDGQDYKEHGWYLLQKNLHKVNIEIADNGSARKIPFFVSMLLEDDHDLLRAALAGATYLEPVPDEMFDIVRDLSKLHSVSNDALAFLDVINYKKMLSEANDIQFFAASQLILLYHSGMSHLERLLVEVGNEMVDIMREPAGQTDEEMHDQRIRAGEILMMLHHAGIRVPGVTLNGGD